MSQHLPLHTYIHTLAAEAIMQGTTCSSGVITTRTNIHTPKEEPSESNLGFSILPKQTPAEWIIKGCKWWQINLWRHFMLPDSLAYLKRLNKSTISLYYMHVCQMRLRSAQLLWATSCSPCGCNGWRCSGDAIFKQPPPHTHTHTDVKCKLDLYIVKKKEAYHTLPCTISKVVLHIYST